MQKHKIIFHEERDREGNWAGICSRNRANSLPSSFTLIFCFVFFFLLHSAFGIKQMTHTCSLLQLILWLMICSLACCRICEIVWPTQPTSSCKLKYWDNFFPSPNLPRIFQFSIRIIQWNERYLASLIRFVFYVLLQYLLHKWILAYTHGVIG